MSANSLRQSNDVDKRISAIRFHNREVAGEYLKEIFWQKLLVDRVKNLKYFLKCSSHY